MNCAESRIVRSLLLVALCAAVSVPASGMTFETSFRVCVGVACYSFNFVRGAAKTYELGGNSFSGPPSIQEFRFPAGLSVGDTAFVGCAVRKGSVGPFQLSWQKNESPLESHAGVRISRQSDSISTLTIREVSPSDNGNYTCVAQNADGVDVFTAHLAVSGSDYDYDFFTQIRT